LKATLSEFLALRALREHQRPPPCAIISSPVRGIAHGAALTFTLGGLDPETLASALSG
jgi:hypothetical protein